MAQTHHYLFDTATQYNDSTGTSHLTATASASINASGKLNECFQTVGFDANGAAYSLTNILPTSGSFTIAFWLYTESLDYTNRIITIIPSPGTSGFYLDLFLKLRYLQISDFISGSLATGNGTIPATTWIHVIISWDGTNWNVYLNNTIQTLTGTSFSTNANTYSASSAFTIQYGSVTAITRIDDLRIYDNAIDATERSRIYNSGSGTQSDGVTSVLVMPDRVLETTTTVGTGSLSLAGAVTGYNSFLNGVGANNMCYYALDASNSSAWEVGLGTLDSLGTTLTRTSILSSSNSNAVVNLSAGTKRVYVTYPGNFVVPSAGYIGANNNSPPNYTPGGRLTVSSTVPVYDGSTATLYYLPYVSDLVYLTNSTGNWIPYTFTSVSLAISPRSAGSTYDVFLYNNAGTLTLELSTVFTGGTTRVDALALRNGVYVKNSDATRLWLGTIRMATSTVITDAETGRFVWNAYNRVMKFLSAMNATVTASSITPSPTITNVGSLQLKTVCGSTAAEPVTILLFYTANSTVSSLVNITAGIGVNTTSAFTVSRAVQNFTASSVFIHGSVAYSAAPSSIGYNFYAFNGTASSSAQALGSATSSGQLTSGMQGVCWC